MDCRAWWVALLLPSCAWLPCGREATRPVGASRCDYEVSLLGGERGELDVRVRCDGDEVRAFVASEAATADLVANAHTNAGPARRDGARFELPAAAGAELRYRLSLAAVARRADDIDVAAEVGGAWVSPVSTWMLRPTPAAPGTELVVRVHTAADTSFATGLEPIAPETYHLTAGALPTATYAVFGQFARERIRLPGPPSAAGAAAVSAVIDVATLRGPLVVSPAQRSRWLRESAAAVARFWHGFPVPRALVVIVPTVGHPGVVAGKTVAVGGAAAVIHLGAEATEEALYRDWILVHELFHLGVPSLPAAGKWLDEGLATYYEPIIRARAGWRSAASVWQELADGLPRGLEAVEHAGVERAGTVDGTYWGGALLALLADVETRRDSGGEKGLEDGLRAVLEAGGDATRIWALDRVIAVVDARLGAPRLRRLAEAHGRTGKPVGLTALLGDLGVERTAGAVVLRDEAPLAAVRKKIIDSAP